MTYTIRFLGLWSTYQAEKNKKVKKNPMDITIYIPTKGRNCSLRTLEYILKYSDIKPILVHPPNENHYYNGILYDKTLHVDLKYLGQVWQYILENCPTEGVVIIDDDLKFDVRYNGIAGLLQPVKNKELNEMFKWIKLQLENNFVHGAISIRRGNNFTEETFKDCTNAKDCLFFNKTILLKENIRLDRLKTMQDFDITLQLLSLGYPNRVNFNWSCDQKDPCATGGTTLYRTPEVQKEAAFQLATFWPDFVKVVQKSTINKIKIYGESRYDVRISWRRCWNNRSKNHKTLIDAPEPIL